MLFAGRTFRRSSWGYNPLRRPIDRVEAWITVVLALALVLAVPGVAWRAGRAAYAAGLHKEQVERDRWVQTEAVLVANADSDAEDPQRVMFPARTVTESARVRATVRWAAPDGSMRTGVILVSANSRPGTRVQVWTDANGNLADPPQQRIQTTVDSVAVAALTGTGAMALVAVARLLVRRSFDARRMAQWEAAWWQFEPRWTGRS